MYFADSGNSNIRKITISTGIITIVAGSGSGGYIGDNGPATSAKLKQPQGVALDSSGNIYIGDYSNNRVRKVTVSTGIITTIAGSSTSGSFSGDNGAATSATLNYAYGVAVDSSGDVYVTDYYNHRIRKVTVSTGIITTIAGTGTGSYSGDGGDATAATLYYPYALALDSSGIQLRTKFLCNHSSTLSLGNLYVADWGNGRVRKITVPTSTATTPRY